MKLEQPEIPTKACFDSVRLSQVVINLLSNAIKFTPNEKKIQISFSKDTLQPDKDEQKSSIAAIRITIKDEGIGIPKEDLEKVFDKFIQSSKTKAKDEGTGLGLAISRKIVLEHYGRIWAESDHHGTQFHVSIPLENQRSSKDE